MLAWRETKKTMNYVINILYFLYGYRCLLVGTEQNKKIGTYLSLP